jgi:hypothetical protein
MSESAQTGQRRSRSGDAGGGGQESTGSSTNSRLLFIGARRALIGGLVAGGIALAAQFTIGQIYSGAEARQLLEAVIPSARALGGGIVTASASIIALMLTLLSLSHQTSSQFERVYFERIQRIALFSAIALAGSILLMLLMTMPITQSNNAPDTWFKVFYYAFIVIAAGLSGLFVAVVMMLYNAIQGIVRLLQPGVDASIVADDGPQASHCREGQPPHKQQE